MSKKTNLYDTLDIPSNNSEDNLTESVGASEFDFSVDDILAEFSNKAPSTDASASAIDINSLAQTPVSVAESTAPHANRRAPKPSRNAPHDLSGDTIPYSKPLRDKLLEAGAVIPEKPEKKQITVEEYSAQAKSRAINKRIRTIILFFVCIPVCYLTFGYQLGLYIPEFISYIAHPFRYLFSLVLLQGIAMFICVDVIADGIRNLLTLKPNMNSVVAFSGLATLAHAISIMFYPEWGGWLPYCAISCVSLAFVMLANAKREIARVRVCSAVISANNPAGVFCMDALGETTVFKRDGANAMHFISHLDDSDGSERFWSFFAPLLIVAALAFAAVTSFGLGDPFKFFWALAAVCSVAVPFFAPLAYVLPFSKTVKNLKKRGSAISGWYSATSISKYSRLVITDNDIFPKGTLLLHGLKVLGNYSLEKTLSYAASIVAESKSGLTHIFKDLLQNQYVAEEKVTNLVFHESGGIEAEINGDRVLLGTSGFMLRMGVRVTDYLNAKNAVFIAISASLAGVFNINYKPQAEARKSIMRLLRRQIIPVLATIDFNLTPIMIEKIFDLPTGCLDYPDIEDRVDLVNADIPRDSTPIAILARSGITPYSYCVLVARRLRKVTTRNIWFSTMCSLIGMMLMFYLTFIQSPASASPYNVFLFLALWTLPMYLLSLRVKK